MAMGDKIPGVRGMLIDYCMELGWTVGKWYHKFEEPASLPIQDMLRDQHNHDG
jgi:hypothetical protein